ncbi:MAG: efflux RND transporter periplasmic adaptor subunit [Candidimonas sp.]|nr:MAG: efflux RND transporter periplasmic adaptor subunit [Candidimonas sp.]TAM22438.1 MAG: efflux RND transporter periplasmic adaptor subunit [Candidimonas sp.]
MAGHLPRTLLLLAASTLFVCLAGGHDLANARNAPPLASIVVHAQNVQHKQIWDGVVEAVRQVTIAAQTNARVLELPYDVNDSVPEGAVLVRFSNVEQKAARNVVQAQIVSAQATYDEALASYKRYAELYAEGSGSVSKEQLDQQRARRDTSLAALRSVRAQLNGVEQALNYTVLRAPYAGIITHRYVRVGEAVQAGPPSPQPLIAMESLDNLRVDVPVPQSAVDAIRRFHAADVWPTGDGNRRIVASSVDIFPYADPSTHTFTVRLQLPRGNNGLYPGMTVKVAFAVGKAKRLRIPASALVQRGEIVGVYVIGEHGMVLRQIRTGNRYDSQIEVLSGLDDGERIVTDPVAAMNYLVAQHASDPSAHD